MAVTPTSMTTCDDMATRFRPRSSWMILSCPVCENWQLEFHHRQVSMDELDAIAREHFMECFGLDGLDNL